MLRHFYPWFRAFPEDYVIMLRAIVLGQTIRFGIDIALGQTIRFGIDTVLGQTIRVGIWNSIDTSDPFFVMSNLASSFVQIYNWVKAWGQIFSTMWTLKLWTRLVTESQYSLCQSQIFCPNTKDGLVF